MIAEEPTGYPGLAWWNYNNGSKFNFTDCYLNTLSLNTFTYIYDWMTDANGLTMAYPSSNPSTQFTDYWQRYN
jgi:hypothetical protein